MIKLVFNLPVILVLTAVPSPAGAQGSALTNPLVDQSGCIDFSGEYMGCLTLGPPIEDQLSAHVRTADPKAIVDLGPAASTMASQFNPSSIHGLPTRSAPASPSSFASRDTQDVLNGSGHLGAP
jgi:hypothetical protein